MSWVASALPAKSTSTKSFSTSATMAGAGFLRRAQTGYTATYALTMLVGAVLLVGFLLTRP